MFCTRCGKNITDPVSFCTNCGAPIGQIPSAQPTSTAQNNHTPINDKIPPQQNMNQRRPDNIPPQRINNYPPTNARQMNNHPPIYNAEPPVYQTEKPKKKGKAGKVIGIIFGVIAALLVGLLLLGLLGIGAWWLFTNKKEPEIIVDANVSEVTTEAEYNEDLFIDPLYYFRNEKKSYYKVSNSPSADLNIYTNFNSMDTYYDTLTPNELVYVYGIEDGWACIEYPGSYSGYAWCMADCLFITNDVPDDYNKYEDPIHYFSTYEKAYYRVSGTDYEGLNLRTEPNTDCEVIIVLQESEQVLVYGIEDGWAYVKTVDPRTQNDLFGWCTTEYLSYYDDYYGE